MSPHRAASCLALALLAMPLQPAQAQDIAGQWQCEYGIRQRGTAEKSSAAWFQVTLGENGRFHGAGKAMAAGAALPMTLHGAWTLTEDGVLKMTGVSDVANRQVPFRFVSDVIDATRMYRVEDRGDIEYRTGCDR